MKISIIAAIDEKRGLGKNNDLLFKILEDFKRLRSLTTGHPIVMGRRTFDSIGRVLPNRTNIIVTRDLDFKVEGAIVVHSLEEGLEIAKKEEERKMSLRGGDPSLSLRAKRSNLSISSGQAPQSLRDCHAPLAMTNKENEVFIFGGGEIFKQAIEKGLVDRLYLTIVEGDYGADTFFPAYPEFTKVMSEEKREADGYKYTFLTLEK